MKTSFILPLLFLGAASGSVAMAQSSETFTPAGAMTMARFGHTATLLGDGKVLIAGGYTIEWGFNTPPPLGYAPTATAELYEPATGTFTATGNMTSARAYHTATLLPDGRVLIAAGRKGLEFFDLTTAELYDPSSGTFTATGSMTTPSHAFSNKATLLADGRVLMVGAPYIAEVYDPGTGSFMPTGNRTERTEGGPATLLPDGRVLIVALFATTLYDPRTGMFSVGTNGGGAPAGATLLTNGKVLLVGGEDECGGPNGGATVYDPSTAIFTATGNPSALRDTLTATLLPDGKVLIAGGGGSMSFTFAGGQGTEPFCCFASAELYDASTGLFANTGSMGAGRAGHTATLLNSGRVLITGGSGSTKGPVLATAELYSPPLLVPAAVLFSLSPDGKGRGAILHAATHQVVSPSNPAMGGEALEIYGAGLIDGSVIPPQVAIGGRMAEVLFFGNAPGYAGLNQINVRVPSGIDAGPAVPVRLTYLGRPSNEVTIGVR